MLRLIRTILLGAIIFVIGLWIGLNAKEGEYSGLKDKVLAGEKTAVSLKKENEQVRESAAEVIASLQTSVLNAQGKVSDTTTKLLSKDELGDRLIELGNKLKSGR